MSDSPSSLYLLDTHALIFQMFHAIPQMNAPDGRPTNAVFGVTRDLIAIHEDIQPTYLLCAFDTAAPTFRTTLYPDYKAHRPDPSPDLIVQLPIIQTITAAMNIPYLSLDGYEADDIMATVAQAAAKRGIDVTLCTTDKDCRQIICDRVRMYNLRKKSALDAAALMADWGVRPEQVVDFQALVGDSVDNVPGVQGVGPKTAAKLLQEYGTLDNLVAHADELKQGKLKDNLKQAIATGDLERSRKLVRLDTNVPIDLEWEKWGRQPWNAARLVTIFEELGFRGFAAKARGAAKAAGQAKNDELLVVAGVTSSSMGRMQGDMFAGTPDDVAAGEFPFGANTEPAGDGWKTDYRLVNTPRLWKEFLKELKAQKRFAIDLETTGLDPLR